MTSKQALGLTMNELAEVNAEHVTTISKLEQKLTDMAVQLANAESKCRELAAREVELPTFNIPVRWGTVMICVDMTEIKKRCVDAIRAAGIGVKGE
ncbi:TPA: hypothetical protein ACNVTV_005076 [Citrobacter freundii]|uniref:hypothetical protein n=1 Tax=Citrobacter freundii TaxID=546 RepID=UPI001DB023AB|nr:hypothetical protein [Citrobacter freundii]CAE6263220.1 hypothetical protein AI2642V1_3670 [Citrobacter freundii]CAH3644980.1 hypothetical protein AI2642V1_3670 [Citrobacter freundii]